MKSFLTGSHTVRVARIHLEVSLAVSDIGWFLAVVDSGRVAIVSKTVNTSCPLSHGSTSYQPINKLVNTDRQGELCEQTLSKNSSMSIKLVRKLINVHKTGLLHSPKAWEIFKLQYCAHLVGNWAENSKKLYQIKDHSFFNF